MNKYKKTNDEATIAEAVAGRRPGRPATGKRPRLLLTIPPELDEALTELSDRFEIAKATLIEKQAVLRVMSDIIAFADWARDTAPERESDPDLWARARLGLAQAGPEPLDVTLRNIQSGLAPGGTGIPPVTAIDLDADDLQELKQLLQERRRSRAA